MQELAHRSLIISGATIIDGASERPIEGHSLWIEGRHIKRIAPCEELRCVPGADNIDARGQFAIPGLMNANVHLLCEIRLEILARYLDRYEDLIAEAAQVALKNGLTTVFDTWGPRRHLMAVRDSIDAGRTLGSRVFCAGNIIGLDGPFSPDFDFFSKSTGVASAALVRRINATWVENVGRHLMWLPPEEVASHVRSYIARGIDFVKYASNDHAPGAFLAFSPPAQAAIVNEAHRGGLTAQAHTMSVEGLRIAIEAGCDLIQHANITGPIPIPPSTLEMMAERQTAAVIFPWTDRGMEWIRQNVGDMEWTMCRASDINARNLIRSGTRLLLATDGAIFAPELLSDPVFGKSSVAAPSEHNLSSLASGHFVWFKAMEEKGCAPMEMLRAATRNIAEAYGKGSELGTLQPGKVADVLILDRNPLAAADNYRSISKVIKAGVVVDRDRLPLTAVLTKGAEPACAEEESYIPFLTSRGFPGAVCSCALPFRHLLNRPD